VDQLDDGNNYGYIWSKNAGEPETADLNAIEKYREKSGATRRIRTGDLLITNQLLYQLS
jgi:hypothetical protein